MTASVTCLFAIHWKILTRVLYHKTTARGRQQFYATLQDDACPHRQEKAYYNSAGDTVITARPVRSGPIVVEDNKDSNTTISKHDSANGKKPWPHMKIAIVLRQHYGRRRSSKTCPTLTSMLPILFLQVLGAIRVSKTRQMIAYNFLQKIE